MPIIQLPSAPQRSNLILTSPENIWTPDKGKFTLILDSSQIGNFLTCNEKWNLASRELIRIKRTKEFREAMMMGTYGHAILDSYYKAKAAGKNYSLALSEALRFDIDQYYCQCGLLVSQHPCAECSNLEIVPFELSKEKRKIVTDRIQLYAHHWNSLGMDFIPVNQESVEVGFSVKLFEDSERLFILEGRIDLIATLQGLNCIVDHKFQSKETDLYHNSIQFKNYCLAAHVPMLIINYIRFAAAAKQTTFVRSIVSRTSQDNQNWHGELIQIYNKIAHIIMNNQSFEKNWNSCGGQWGQVCEFAQLCECYDSDVRRTRKEQLYEPRVQFKPW